MPRYEFSDGSSNKFWEITLKGSAVTTSYGRIGAAGQSTTKSFRSPALAQAAYDKLITEKTKKGYVLKSGGTAVASSAQPAGGKLTQRLASIDALLKQANPAAFASLKPGASAAALQTLSKTCFDGKQLPPDLAEFFRWHDGQSEIESLEEDSNRTPLSVSQALSAWKFLSNPKSEISKPWSNTWLPIFTNGAGDYLVYESGGKKPGALIEYWHADEDRDVEFSSLLDWATDLEKSLAYDVKKLKKAPKKAKFALDLTKAAWKKVSSPRKDAVAKKPVGTAYYCQRRYFCKETPFYRVFIKAAPNVWYYAMTTEGFKEAFDEIIEIANKSRPPRDYEWKRNDDRMATEELSQASVKSDLKDVFTKSRRWPTSHIGLYEATVEIFQ